MQAEEIQPFKFFVLFAGASTLAVALGIGLHRLNALPPLPATKSLEVLSERIHNDAPLPAFKEASPLVATKLNVVPTPVSQPKDFGDKPVEKPATPTVQVAAETAPVIKAVPITVGIAAPVQPVKETEPLPVGPPAPKAIPVALSTVSSQAPGMPTLADVGEKPKPGSELATLVSLHHFPELEKPFDKPLSEELKFALPQDLPLPLAYQAVLIHDNDWLAQVLNAGFQADDETPFGDTALCAAVKAGNHQAVEMLLFHGADPSKAGREGQLPIAMASLKRSPVILELLLKAGAEPNAVFSCPVPENLISEVPFPELKTSLRNDVAVTPLMATAARGDVEATTLLLKHGANPDQSTKKYYRYAINYAAEQEFISIMRVLLGRPPDEESPVTVVVDLSQQRAYLSQFGKRIDSTTVSTGREGFSTPAGHYVVTDKHAEWTSTLYHVAMPWFMRLNCSAIGLHAGYVTGEPASHGCIRLPYDKVKKWFGIVKVGDEVKIVD